MLQAKNVSKTYNAGKKIALQDFSIEVPTGSVYGLLSQWSRKNQFHPHHQSDYTS